MTLLLASAVLALSVLVFGLLWKRQASASLAPAPLVLVCVSLFAVTLAGWWTLGRHSQVDDWLSERGAHAQVVASIIAGKPDFEAASNIPAGELARALQRQLVVTPSVEGWYALGLLYEQMQGPDQAIEAARRAVAMETDALAPQILLARVLIDGPQPGNLVEARALLASLARQDPEHEGVLMLTGMAAARDGDYSAAISAWETLQQRHGDDEAGESLARALAELRQRQQREGQWGRIDVTVSAPQGTRAGGTLFVFLRPADSPAGQPLAARRVIADRFPVTVTLSPANWLQPYPEQGTAVVAGARYSEAPGADVSTGVRTALVPLTNEDGRHSARVSLPEAAPETP